MRTLEEMLAALRVDNPYYAQNVTMVREAHAQGRSEMEAEVERLRAAQVERAICCAHNEDEVGRLEAEIASLRAEVARLTEERDRDLADMRRFQRDVIRLTQDLAASRALADRLAQGLLEIAASKSDAIGMRALARAALSEYEMARRGSEGGGR